jgi:AGZA family xanthine/uracil permease-like MFS transporter
MVWRVKGAILIGILVAAAVAWALGLAKIVPGDLYGLAALRPPPSSSTYPGGVHLKGGAGMASRR